MREEGSKGEGRRKGRRGEGSKGEGRRKGLREEGSKGEGRRKGRTGEGSKGEGRREGEVTNEVGRGGEYSERRLEGPEMPRAFKSELPSPELYS